MKTLWYRLGADPFESRVDEVRWICDDRSGTRIVFSCNEYHRRKERVYLEILLAWRTLNRYIFSVLFFSLVSLEHVRYSLHCRDT